jgi:hypothetical protein
MNNLRKKRHPQTGIELMLPDLRNFSPPESHVLERDLLR